MSDRYLLSFVVEGDHDPCQLLDALMNAMRDHFPSADDSEASVEEVEA